MTFFEHNDDPPPFDAYDIKWWIIRLCIAWAFATSVSASLFILTVRTPFS